jgi:two-component system nitrate/nitrite response regulator NarL
MPYNILIVDDHPLVRDGLALLIGNMAGGTRVFKAATAAQALELAEIHSPLDVILLDYGLPDANAGALIPALKVRSGGAEVVVVSGNEQADMPQRMLALGASAFVSKSSAPEIILQTIRKVLTHGRHVAATQAPHGAEAGLAAEVQPKLTARQLDVLLMFAQGLGNKDIALQLGLSEKTVKNHITGLFATLGVVSRLQAVRMARHLHLIV